MGRYPTPRVHSLCSIMSGPNQYAAGPPDASERPGPSNEEEYSLAEVNKSIKELEKVQSHLAYKIELLILSQSNQGRAIDALVSEQAVATRTLNESIRSLTNVVDSLRSGLCSKTAAQGNVRYSK